MGKPEAWSCPYCNRACTVGAEDAYDILVNREIPTLGVVYAWTKIIVCPNPSCRRFTVALRIADSGLHTIKVDGQELSWALLPESQAKPFPDYIPQQLRSNYAEACRIQKASPMASATLSRRCLQGMIRDFWNIKKNRLVDEIDELKARVDSKTWDAIDAVRHVGNIGAHMQKDVNLIVDVEPEEAGLLIWLIETLFAEWYVARHDREERMGQLSSVALAKASARNTPPGNADKGG